MVVNQGELVGIIGPNGAGKTTVFNLVTGIYKPTSGDIRLMGESIVKLKPYQITQRGVARTFQNIRLFPQLMVLDNVRIAYHRNVRYNMLSAMLRLPAFNKEEGELTERALEFLDVFGLADRHEELAKNLPYGEQRRLEIARALATQPSLLLLDEPAAGMNPNEAHRLVDLIRFICERFPRLRERLSQPGGTLSGGEQQMLAMGRGLMANPKILLLDEPSMGLAPILVQQNRRHHPGYPQLRHEHSAGGAERLHGALRRQPGLRAGNGDDQPQRPRGRIMRQPQGARGLPRRSQGDWPTD